MLVKTLCEKFCLGKFLSTKKRWLDILKVKDMWFPCSTSGVTEKTEDKTLRWEMCAQKGECPSLKEGDWECRHWECRYVGQKRKKGKTWKRGEVGDGVEGIQCSTQRGGSLGALLDVHVLEGREPVRLFWRCHLPNALCLLNLVDRNWI